MYNLSSCVAMPACPTIDILKYHILPYLRVDDAVCATAKSSIGPDIILDRVSYKQLHGRIEKFHDCRPYGWQLHVNYFRHGKHHRLDGPAEETSDYRAWKYNGLYHRADGPAIEWYMGDKEWWLHGKRHRLDGPARMSKYATDYWVDGKVYWAHDDDYRRAVQAYVRTQ